MVFNNRKVIQNAFLVEDVWAAAKRWSETTGIGPFWIVGHAPMEDLMYRGKPVAIDASFALAQAGDVQIELIQQHSDGPSAFRDLYQPGQYGFHHVALYSAPGEYDLDLEQYTSQGAEVSVSGAFAGKRFCYIDTTPTLGYMTELLEASEAQDGFFSMLKTSAAEWDGSDPVRKAF